MTTSATILDPHVATYSPHMRSGEAKVLIPSASQLAAIEADPRPLLVLAGPGAGKTFCLTERIRFLIEQLHFDPARICAFTFTNKAAGEIASRLERQLGPRAEQVKRGTIHAYCAELLREFGRHVGLAPGFGIADENYQKSVLRRLAVPFAWHSSLLVRFSAHRFRNQELWANDATVFRRYEEFFKRRNIVDFDMLVLKTAELFATVPGAAATARGRWDGVLVDEFQDLNPFQYAVIRELAKEHGNVFAVGDDEQSIYSWAGADPGLFRTFLDDFDVTARGRTVQLSDNRRCPREVFDLARRLVAINPQLFPDRNRGSAERESGFAVAALSFDSQDAEIGWIIDDLRRDREEKQLAWGDFALLYRKHDIGNFAEISFLTAGVPCRLAQGRALAEDPVVAYIIAALRVISRPTDSILREAFLAEVLPDALVAAAQAQAAEQSQSFVQRLEALLHALPREHDDAKKIRRGFYALRNLVALGTRHTSLVSLVEELLSHRVGEYRTILEDHHDDLSDPADIEEVVCLATRIRAALDGRRPIFLPRLGGAEIALKGILLGIGIRRISFGNGPVDAITIAAGDAPVLGLPLALFKAAQLVSSRDFTNGFRDFTAVDLETTGRDRDRAEIVDIAAVRVRGGEIVAEFQMLIKPSVPIEAGAANTHGIRAEDVANEPAFAEVWPRFHAFCGNDVLVAHNGYQFDFPILRRMARALVGKVDLCTYDTLPLARELHTGSAKLVDLARAHDIDPGQSHRALDDTRTLARVFLALNDRKIARARKTALVNVLDHLGVALALAGQNFLTAEVELLRRLTPPYSLGRYSDCLEFYRFEREQCGDDSLPTTEQLIDELGGERLMDRLRADKTADQRYPSAMLRLRRLLEQCGTTGTPLAEQIGAFLERAVLSQWDGTEPERERVNLLTLHSTKGLEFSRVYVLGVEDAQFLSTTPTKETTKLELEEARRLLYVGMTRTKERLVLTRVRNRDGKPTGGHRFLDEMGLESSPAVNEG